MTLPEGWEVRGATLWRELVFKDFRSAFDFMNKVAAIAEAIDHHPDWTNSWNVVRISLTTHSAGSTITEKDIELATRINSLLP